MGMVTETMLFLSVKQQNWDAAYAILNQLRAQGKSAHNPPIYNAVNEAANGDKIARFLLTLWVHTTWNN